jgi:hypothetical protein
VPGGELFVDARQVLQPRVEPLVGIGDQVAEAGGRCSDSG